MKELDYYEELYVIANSASRVGITFNHRLYHCTAWYSDVIPGDKDSYVFLKSYNTVVAVYLINERKVVRFGKYSNTTYQHMRKFRQAMWLEHVNALDFSPWDIQEVQCEFVNWYK